MQIPDEIRQCVAFLAYRRKDAYETKATVFFVGYPLESTENQAVCYAITARHVIDTINDHGSDSTVYVRLNNRLGGSEYIPVPVSEWVFNDDPRIDVAVTVLPDSFSGFAHKLISMGMFISPEVIAREELGPGDEVFFPGLFSQHKGEKANVPIIRIGNIAAMPTEAVKPNSGVLQASYLIEARSIGGLSGSPVLWHRGLTRVKNGREITDYSYTGPRFFLLGLVHGHYEETEESRSINMGIAIVVPASDILATLNQPKLAEHRVKFEQDLLAARVMEIKEREHGGQKTGEHWALEEENKGGRGGLILPTR